MSRPPAVRACAISWPGLGHDSERAAMIYQHAARGADQVITGAIDVQIEAEQRDDQGGDNGATGSLGPAS